MSKYLIITLIILASLGVLHQRLFTEGGWWSWQQWLHHESLVTVCLSLAGGIVLGEILRRLKWSLH